MATPNLSFMWDTVVESVNSTDGDDGLLNTMVVKNVKTGEKTTIEADQIGRASCRERV